MSTTTEQSVATIAQPVATIEQPVVTTTPQPVATIAQPAATTEQPVATIEQPVATIAQPVATTTAQPVATIAQSVEPTPAKPKSTFRDSWYIVDEAVQIFANHFELDISKLKIELITEPIPFNKQLEGVTKPTTRLIIKNEDGTTLAKLMHCRTENNPKQVNHWINKGSLAYRLQKPIDLYAQPMMATTPLSSKLEGLMM